MKAKRLSENGYSLPELLIVLVVFCVMVTLALATFGKQKVQIQRQDFSRQLKVSLERARFDSIKRRTAFSDQMATVTINSPYSYILASDLDSNGTLDANEVRLITFPQNGKIKLLSNTTAAFPITVKFNFRGQATAIDGNNSIIDPVFTICDSDCTLATATADNSNIITVSPSGTVNLLNGGKSPPSVVPANVTNVNTGSKINQTGTVGN